MTTTTATLADFIAARLDEDEAAAREVPPLGHNFDMGGNRQDERWVFDRTLPSTADGMGNWSEHRGPTTAAHFSRHDPARVLAQVASLRQVVELHAVMPVRPHYSGQGFVDGCCATCTAAGEYGGPTDDGRPNPCPTLRALASIWADHESFDAGWAE